MLGDILFRIQLLVTHLVTAFFVGDNHDILGIYVACGLKQQEAWGRKNVRKHALVTPNVLSITFDYHN